MIAANVVLLVVAIGLAVPCLVFFVECIAALATARRKDAEAPAVGRVVILVPAHDEASMIAETLSDLLRELGEEDHILVIADNCTDETAAIARSAGAMVVERRDPDRRGKGYALQLGFAVLAENPPAVVVVVDADCHVSTGSIRRLAAVALARKRPVQADYLIAPNERSGGLTAISTLAFLVRNRVRPTGLANLGLPCHLMGTGMAFPWEIVPHLPAAGSHLAEDLFMSIELASAGFAPLFCPCASVTSLPPERSKAALGQRRRWEHGHLGLMFRHAPRLMLRSLLRLKPTLAAMALDLMVPPLALLVTLVWIGGAVALAGVRMGVSPIPLWIIAGAFGLVTVAVLSAWLTFARRLVPAHALLLAPFYLLWKLPLYVSFFLRGAHRSWDRTERTPKQGGS